jgi:hypothetical protein
MRTSIAFVSVVICLSLVSVISGQTYRKVRVAFQKGLCAHGDITPLVALVNGDSRFEAKAVDDADIDSLDEIKENFDTVYLGGSGLFDVDGNQISLAAASAIAAFVQAGGGLVTSSFLPSFVTSAGQTSALQPVVPVIFDANPQFCTTNDNKLMNFLNISHYLATGLPSSSFLFNSYCIYSPSGLSPNANCIAQLENSVCNGLNSVTAREGVVTMGFASGGRSVYLCFPYCGVDTFYSAQNLRINDHTRITFFNSLLWTANIEPCPPDCGNSGVNLHPIVAVVLLALFSLLFI